MYVHYTGCTSKDIRDRFKKLALKWHPDKNLDNPEDAQRVGHSYKGGQNHLFVPFCRNFKLYRPPILNWPPQKTSMMKYPQ